jgi:hypothetical protein
MDGQMRAVQTNKQQVEQTEPRMDAEHPPKKPPGRAIGILMHRARLACGRETAMFMIRLLRLAHFLLIFLSLHTNDLQQSNETSAPSSFPSYLSFSFAATERWRCHS